MTSSRSARRQRIFGGTAGVVLLAFALVYHFFPNALDVEPRPRTQPVSKVAGRGTPMGFQKRPGRVRSELNAGPPIALAPRAVLERRARKRVAAALAAASASSTPSKPTAPPSPEVLDLLKHADKAFAAGNLAGDDHSAAALYIQVLRARPSSRRAASGLAKIHVQLMLAVEDHLADGEVDAAAERLAKLKRLPGTQADVERLSQQLDELRKVRPLLAQAANLVQQGNTLAPEGDNALALYRRVLKIDAGNSVARQGIEQIQRHVLDKALGAIASDDFAGADEALSLAAKILPGSQALQDTRGRIEGIRRQRAASILTQARTALDSGNLKLAENLKQKALSISPDVQGVEAFNTQLHNARLYASYKPGQVFADRFVDIAGHGPAMVVIPTGSFMMGSPDSAPDHQANESPRHRVTIDKGFAISRSEITVGQFREFVQNSGYMPDSVRLDGASVYDARSGLMRDDGSATWQDDYAGHPAGSSLPVVNVSWNDAHAYVQWLSQRTGKHYRLPSESQFAYALRAGTTTPYWWGSGTPSRVVENVTGSGDQSRNGRRWTHAFQGYSDGFWGPAPIQSFLPNPFGLYDIDGNVSEWVRDCWHDNYLRAPDDGGAWINPGCGSRVLRGGSWGSAPDQVRSAYRQGALATTRSGRVGFRIIRVL
ncbi:MAG TPA: SUMF1/EgtB/PvdO family nonheme iron enzyme [Oleiagrimonas sp.]|nr:SUMF1/EgtB/PvdO family nonheme iron enzyme [Oleiagrimonas sp.]